MSVNVAAYSPYVPSAVAPRNVKQLTGQSLHTIRTQDGFAADQLQRAEAYINWLQANGVQGYVGEIGWPNDSPYSNISDDPFTWNKLAAPVVQALLNAGVWVNVFSVQTNTDWDVRAPYSPPSPATTQVPLGQVNSQAEVVEGVFVPAGGKLGVTWDMGEIWGGTFSNNGEGAGWSFALSGGTINQTRAYGRMQGKWATVYNYGDAQSYQFLASRPNISIIRMEFLWERVQRTLGAALDITELARLDAAITAAGNAGLQVILDCHNFGQYRFWNGSSVVTQTLGDSVLTVANFADLWRRLSAHYQSNATVIGYDLMNEPVGSANWEGVSGGAQAAVTAIRANGDTKMCSVSTTSGAFTGIKTPWITDSANNTRYTDHFYFDSAYGLSGQASSYAHAYSDYAAVANTWKPIPAVPQSQAQTCLPPSGGATIDTQARTAIDNIITALEQAGVMNAHQQAYDTFTRADSSSLGTSSGGQAWQNSVGSFSIASNKAVPHSGGGTPAYVQTQLANCTVSATVTLSAGFSQVGVALRVLSLQNYMRCELQLDATHNACYLRSNTSDGRGQQDISSATAIGLVAGSTYTIAVQMTASGYTVTVTDGGGSTVTTFTGSWPTADVTIMGGAQQHGVSRGASEDGGSAFTAFGVTTSA